MIIRTFLFILLSSFVLLATGCNTVANKDSVAQQSVNSLSDNNTKTNSSNSDKKVQQKESTLIANHDNNKQPITNKPQVATADKENSDVELDLDTCILLAPTSVFTIQLPSYFEFDGLPKETSLPGIDEISSTHGTMFPAQAEYIGRPNNDAIFFFWASYVSADRIAIEKKNGQEFRIDLDGSVSSYIKAMEDSYKATSSVENISVSGLDSRLVTLEYNREGYPSIMKNLFIAKNDDLWQIKFICLNNGIDNSKELKLIDYILRNIKVVEK